MMEKRPMVCVTDTDGKLFPLGGNMRYKALIELGYKDIPDSWVSIADNWSEEKRKEFTIKDNVSFGAWDWDLIANEWEAEQVTDWGLDLPVFDEIDYSGKNKEIDPENFEDEMIIKLKYTEEDYLKVKEQLSKIAETAEQAVWKLLGNE